MTARRALAGLVLLVGASLLLLVMPPAVAACSCVQSTMDDVRGQPDVVVFTGITEPPDARGFPVTVTRWFQGGGILEPRVWLHPDGFDVGAPQGGGGDCSIRPLPVGSAYVFIAYPTEGMYGVGLCSPHAPLAGPEGQAMLADALRVFGEGGPPANAPPATAAPTTAAPVNTPDPSVVASILLPLTVALVLGGAALLTIVAVLRRTRPDGD
jgi:hypothetical protein